MSLSQSKYDSNFCGSLPVHQINLIQPYGYLIVLKKDDLSIVQASENISEVLDQNVEEIINKPFENYITDGELLKLKERFSQNITDKIPLQFTVKKNGRAFNYLALVHVKNDYFVIEMEKGESAGNNSFIDVFEELKYIMASINHKHSLEKVCQVAVEQLKKISGFDTVLMYRFDEEWNGTVIAESVDEGRTSYFGLKFPASDIPKQVRQLYLRNPYRMIPSREYEPVRLYPVINPITHTLIDLSDCNLRSVAGVHLEYMKNMDISASMSVRVLKDEKLWGLISCHNKTSKFISYEMRSIFELLSDVISSKITSVLNKEEFETRSALNEKRSRLIDYIYAGDNWVKAVLDQKTNLLSLLSVSGIAIAYEGIITTAGKVPDKANIENLVYWLQAKEVHKLYAVEKLSELTEIAEAFTDVGSGIIVLPINANKGEFIIGFRPEFVRTVEWGGNPNEAINLEANGKSYHPRNSFRKWKEEVKNASLPWSEQELEVAEDFRNYVFEYLLRKK